MFNQLPSVIDEVRGGSDAAPLVDAAVGWAKFVAAGEAQRLAFLAEWAAVWLADADEDTCLCAVDDEDDVVAQMGLAFGVSPGWAYRDLQIGAAMRERFPQLAALFLRGEISARVMATVVERTVLVVDDDALANIDAACVEAATVSGWSGLSYQKLKNAVDVWIERHDPDAVRRVRNTVRGRGVSVQHNDDKSGVTTIVMRLTKPGAALFMGRVRKMAKAVCPYDPRTMDQRMADAAEALAADADHLQCLCGAATCPAAADGGAASRFVVHIYAEAEAVAAEPDPLIHGEGVFTKPDGVTVTYPKKTMHGAAAQAEASVGDTHQEPDEPRGASPRQSRAHSAPEAPTNSPPSPRQCGRPPGYLPGFGVVPSALIAALLAAGATVRRIQTPGIEPADGYRIPTAQREFVQARDLCCRAPGCDRPIYEADLDHTIAWGGGGPTHVSNTKGYCRWHHLIKTFRAGWSDIQNPDGTVIVNTPTGHTYTSIPFSRILFPTSSTASPPVQRGSPRKEAAADKSAKMPKRKRTKVQDRAYRIAAERALNAAHRAYNTDPAKCVHLGFWSYLGDPAEVTDSDDPPPF